MRLFADTLSASKKIFADTYLQIKSYLQIEYLQIKNHLQIPHMETSFWYGKGDIPNEKIRLPPLEVHFGIGGCGRTVSAEGAGQE